VDAQPAQCIPSTGMQSADGTRFGASTAMEES
jgi:hypothetical protein